MRTSLPISCRTQFRPRGAAMRLRLVVPVLLLLGSAIWLAGAGATAQAPSTPVPLLNANGSLKLAVLGDFGTGSSRQYELAAQMVKAHTSFPYELVLLVGDNLYGSDRPQDFVKKFEKPYKPLLDAGVKFYASLGNHDDPNQRFYKPFNMNGERYYTYTKGPVRFFVLDSKYMDEKQLAWLERELKASNDPWKIGYFHHPLYSSG